MEADHLYFARRAQEERAAADAAGSEKTRGEHLQRANRYQDLADSLAKTSRYHNLDAALNFARLGSRSG